MLRMTLLTVAMCTLFPVTPYGCPPSASSGDESAAAERDIISTTAEAVDAETGLPVEKVTFRKNVLLRASATASEEGGAVFYSWLQSSGPGVQLTDADQAVAGFVAPSLETEQTVVIMVTAWDEAGAVGRADVSIVVTADPNYSPYDWGPGTGTGGSAPGPVADAGQALRVLPGDTVTLDGSGSSGDQLVYRWRQVSGPEIELNEADTISPTFVVPAYEPEGENKIVIELAVTDAGNRTVTDQVTITIRDPEASETRVVISTNMGDFVIELDPGNAPVTVENFLQYVDDGFYDGLIFHRVIADFVIQTGGYLPGLNQSEEGDMIVNESDNGLSNVRGSVAMARTSDPHSAASQWYVNLVDNLNLDYNYETDEWGYTVFGTVIDGMEVVDRIGAVPTETRSGFNDVPVNDVIVRSATRE